MAEKIKLNFYQYWIEHCWMSGWQTIGSSWRMWSDLMTGNYEGYALLSDDDPYTECYEWFWETLGEDNTYPREFLEYLCQMSEDVITGKVKTYPMTKEILEKLDDLVEVNLENL